MNVASLELCKEFYELSGYDGTYRFWSKGVNGDLPYMVIDREMIWKDDYYPAYDLSYLLRKLPHKTEWGGLFVMSCNDGQWEASYFNFYENWHNHEQYSRRFQEAPSAVADTPEDAACDLAIELFRQGILPTKEGENG